jgi:hypothetical protein
MRGAGGDAPTGSTSVTALGYLDDPLRTSAGILSVQLAGESFNGFAQTF